MLTRLYVDNYKSLVNFELKLDQPLTVLIGGAGTGKSAVLEVLDALGKLFRGVAAKDAFPSGSRTKFQSRDVQRIELTVSLPEHGEFKYELELKHEDHEPHRLETERLTVNGNLLFEVSRNRDRESFTGQSGNGDGGKSGAVQMVVSGSSPVSSLAWTNSHSDAFHGFIKHAINAAPVAPIMKQVSMGPEQDVPDRNMAQIGGWLRRQTSDLGFSGELMKHLKERIPGLDKLKVEMLTKDLFKVDAAFVQDGARFTLSLDELSDGQRQLIALYALFVAAKEQKRLLILDEPENYLALAEIQPWLRALEQELEDEGGQVILSSHSHTTLNLLAKGHGILLSRKNGLTTAAPFPAGELTPAQMVELGIDGK